MSLASLEKALTRDLARINYPPPSWKIQESDGILDVAIIGAGMSGMVTAFTLLKQGVSHLQIFDERKKGQEGPWITYARMKTLRSPKNLTGPALDLPNLTFHAWFEAQFGSRAWEKLGKISTPQWMEYLKWYRKVLKLPIRNNVKLLSISPHKDYLKLVFSSGLVFARKLVLATGREGFGGYTVPDFVTALPASKWAHTSSPIDFKPLRKKRIGILGCGSSAFDAAGEALEQGAKSVDMLMRRPFLPCVNTEKSLSYPGCFEGFFYLNDMDRWKFLSHCNKRGGPPPIESLQRVASYSNFKVHVCAKPEKMVRDYDFLIVATGFQVDGSKLPLLRPLMKHVLLWKDRGFKRPEELSLFPYLGPHFELIEKKKGAAPYLKNIYCFNHGAMMSHGFICGDIPGISIGARRVAEGIVRSLFGEDSKKYYHQLTKFHERDFDQEDFSFFF